MEISDSRRGEYLEYIKNFCLMDDDFMRIALNDIPSVQEVLRIIMDKPDLEVTKVDVQYDVYSIDRHSVRLDVRAVDSGANEYNIEIQRTDKGAAPKRARYNSSLMDADILKKGEDYEKLPQTYVIFITESDLLKGNKPLYHIDRIIRETGEVFNDKSHIIYVNNEIQDDTSLGKLMRDFTRTKAEDMHSRVLSERVKFLKEAEEGVSSMCRAMEELQEKAAREAAIEATKKATSAANVLNIKSLMNNVKISIEQAMDWLGVPASEREMYKKLVLG